jgi:prepilin signal peptidase PulO-like enzyme (type II secretory pathway)
MLLFLIWLMGSAVGSFAGMLIMRNSRNESILFPRSHCDNCNQSIYLQDLIPIFSYLMLRGKCRFCHTSINILPWILELGMSLLFFISYLDFHSITLSIIILLLFYLSIEDCQSHLVSSNIICCLAIINFLYNFNLPSSLIYIFIYLILNFLNNKLSFIGNADIDIIMIILNLTNYYYVTIIILIASSSCLIWYLLFSKKQSEMPFIPFLFMAYLFKICI